MRAVFLSHIATYKGNSRRDDTHSGLYGATALHELRIRPDSGIIAFEWVCEAQASSLIRFRVLGLLGF